MKKYIKLIVLFFLFTFITILAQNAIDTSKSSKTIQVSAGIGFKYHTNEESDRDKDIPKFAFTIEASKDFWNTGKHLIGLEMIGHKDTYAESPMYTKDFSLILNIFYKRHSHISKKIAVETDIGFGIFSNDVASLLSPFINIQIKYALASFDLFIKNNFRTGFPLLSKNIPWIISTGIAFKI